MQITRNVLPLSDLYQWLTEKKLIINRDYQRGGGLWPNAARSYFIDTILNGFPFPKITLRQTINTKTAKALREVVDGQQRLMTIKDFIDNNLALSTTSKKYAGKKFLDLDEVTRELFLAYEISVDIITVGTNDEVLEIFRRMNSYTLALNDPEKRHATYQGAFKWFILDMINQYTPFLEKAGILTIKEIGRMKDADLMTELCQIIMDGIVDRAPSKLEKIYKDNDEKFELEEECKTQLTTTLDFIKNEMAPIFETDDIPVYFFQSIFAALVYNRYGLKNINCLEIGFSSTKQFASNIVVANAKILDMLRDVNEKNEAGRYKEFVSACLSTTHRKNHRTIRLKHLVSALQEE